MTLEGFLRDGTLEYAGMDAGFDGSVHYSDGFAAFYERYYTKWIRAVAPVLSKLLLASAPSEPTILDLCCGTGESASVFCEEGWRVVGVDLSRGMLGRATEKLAAHITAGRVKLLQADVTTFSIPSPVDACVCLDGALNHLLAPSKMRQAFARVSDALESGGQFVMDLYEPSHFQRWHNISFLDEEDAVIAKRGVWDPDLNLGLLRVSGVFGTGPSCARVDQNLRSRTYAREEIEAWLRESGFEIRAFDAPVPPCPCGSPVPMDCRTVYRAVKL